jgi:hypothetical protein
MLTFRLFWQGWLKCTSGGGFRPLVAMPALEEVLYLHYLAIGTRFALFHGGRYWRFLMKRTMWMLTLGMALMLLGPTAALAERGGKGGGHRYAAPYAGHGYSGGGRAYAAPYAGRGYSGGRSFYGGGYYGGGGAYAAGRFYAGRGYYYGGRFWARPYFGIGIGIPFGYGYAAAPGCGYYDGYGYWHPAPCYPGPY